MDLNEIAIFIKVVQSGSFSRAAQALGLPNSTVSYKVSMLEKRLGVTLIQRTTRKLNITAAGEAFYKRCVIGMEEIKAAEQELAAAQGEPQGLLRITAPLDLGSNMLPQVISRYQKKFLKVRVEILLTDRRVDLVSENVDLAIRAGQLQDSSLKARKIGTTYFVPVASPKYIKENGYPHHPKDLATHDCILFTSLSNSWKLTSSKGSLQLSVQGKTIINHLDMIRMMTLQNDGVGFLPTSLVYSDIKSGKLVRLLPEWRSSISPVHLVYPQQRFVSSKLSSFLEFAGKELKENLSKIEI